ncbi:MAG: malectin domain-containing carbohydrate-binding protein [Terracidiphilus sp.]|jgi:hypothetical protein
MPETSVLSSNQEERDELNAVIEALAKFPRLSRLARYLGEKYFLGEADQLHEYNIATEVFGRSKTTFDAGEDAIARVEAHRLRKKLKEFYENSGKDHTVKLTIPTGTYVPLFIHRAETPTPPDPLPDPHSSRVEPSFPSEVAPSDAPALGQKRPPFIDVILRLKGGRWVYPSMAALVIAALALYLAFYSGAIIKGTKTETNAAQSPAAAQSPPSGSGALPIRIIAGYAGKPRIDSAGAVWQADQYFRNGGIWTLPTSTIARTSDPLLFEQWRTGDFFYDIPLKPGVYELHLYFVTQNTALEAPTFTVSVNGEKILPAFDVNSDALGENIADERIFRDISPATDGFLHIAFTSERGAPSLNALEVLPGIPHKQLPIRLVTQPISFTDHDGQFWHPDNYYMNGRISTQRQQISGSPDPDLFATERYGHFTYAIPVDTRGRYTLVLHFAEFYFGPQASSVGGIGSRLFRVMCNGSVLLDNFDIFREAGSRHALTKTFYHLKPTAQGKLNLTFEPITNNATVSGIEVIDESQ